MRVIKNGKNGDLKDWKVKVICKKSDQYDPDEGCGAELEVTESDLFLMYWEGSFFIHHYAAVKCPQCGHCFGVKDVPDPIWQRLNTAKNRRKAIFDGFSDAR